MVYTIYILYGVCDMSAAIEQLVPTSPNDHRLHLTETDILPLVVLRGCILQLKRDVFFTPPFNCRCPTGPGIYAFKCRRAENLFNLLQSKIRYKTTKFDLKFAENCFIILNHPVHDIRNFALNSCFYALPLRSFTVASILRAPLLNTNCIFYC